MTLCIIDMQDQFCATRSALNGVLKELDDAMRRGEHIIVAEYRNCGKTVPEIRRLLRKYPHKHFCRKSVNDGSTDIMRIAKRYKIPLDNVRVVGVNLSYCVYETVAGMACYYKDVIRTIFVPLHATACTSYDWGKVQFANMTKDYKHVKVA